MRSWRFGAGFFFDLLAAAAEEVFAFGLLVLEEAFFLPDAGAFPPIPIRDRREADF